MHEKLLAGSSQEYIPPSQSQLQSQQPGSSILCCSKSCWSWKPSNQFVLSITAASFSVFVVGEVAGAVAGNSLALLGDAAAMSVDVFNYLSNMYAEYVKSKGNELSLRALFAIEVLVPLVSILMLVSVTSYVASEAIIVLATYDAAEEDDVNVAVMFGFAGVNFVIDILSGLMFFMRGKDAFLAEVGSRPSELSNRFSIRSSMLTSDSIVSIIVQRTNLNMMSALIAVTGDTLRTISVFVAALVTTFSNVPGSIADATAALVVTATIFFIAIAVITEIYKNAKRFRWNRPPRGDDRRARASVPDIK